MIDVCVVGLGAIGTFYALVLEKSGQARVTAVCRSNYHILSAAGKGVTVHADSLGVFRHWKPYRVVSKAEEAADRKYQFIICTTKALPDVVTTPKLLGPLLTYTDTFVLIQNGLDIHLDLQKARPDADVISCCAWIDVMPLDGGRVVEQTGPDKLVSGLHAYLPSHHAPLRAARGRTVLSAFDELLVAGGAGSETVVEIDAARWRKVLWNVTFSTLCTIVRQPVADILCIRVLDVMVPTIRGLMAELIPHLSRHHQFWRLLAHHVAYTNSSELFVWELLLYNTGIHIERQFGSVKFASFAVLSTLVATLLEFGALLALHRCGFNYIPAGPTALAFNLLYQYSKLVPKAYHFRIFGIPLHDKIFVYILAFQLAISQPWPTVIVAAIGILTGAIYRSDLANLKAYRLPPWLVSLSARFLLPLVGSTRAPRRTNRALQILGSRRA
ncbi:hypothetical protein EWM64_g5305 [Hericium alpestre]|uniref:Ketopantoate reductase N-terminal domain-containing protein n=1 Tax=Hericium alpestre TaxID=135208 RepID=A0A4Y9ZZ64_9AGAM|nr:hypothetical protein EWM64_g5305 [Hericium alpestre]